MPDIYLGPSGSETLLPPINWSAGGERELPLGYKKNLEKAKMADGSVRVNVKTNHQRSFSLEWDLLTLAQVLAIRVLAELNEPLRYQDNRIDATWRWVYVTSFEPSTLESTFAATAYYRAALELEEIT